MFSKEHTIMVSDVSKRRKLRNLRRRLALAVKEAGMWRGLYEAKCRQIEQFKARGIE